MYIKLPLVKTQASIACVHCGTTSIVPVSYDATLRCPVCQSTYVKAMSDHRYELCSRCRQPVGQVSPHEWRAEYKRSQSGRLYCQSCVDAFIRTGVIPIDMY